MMLLVPDKEAKQKLKTQIVAKVVPHLKSLGFSSPRKVVNGYSGLWLRDRGTAIDMLDFQWSTYGRPAYVINFREVSHPDDLKLVRGAPSKAAPWDFGLRASMVPKKERWFGPRFLLRWPSTIEEEILRVVLSTCQRLTEISEFLAGGNSSKYFVDSFLWNDQRLAFDPPPWNDKAPGSQYHLPVRRVGTSADPWGNSEA